jgi:hypothetical protein
LPRHTTPRHGPCLIQTPPLKQGTLTPAVPGSLELGAPLLSSVNGRFSLDAAGPALVSFGPGCADKLARASVKYWNVAPVSPGSNVTLSPVSNLVEAYRRAACTDDPAGCRAVGDAALYDEVYGLFGFKTQAGADFKTWEGIVMGTRFGVSVYVLNQRVMTLLTAVSEMMATLCEDFTTSPNPNVQLAVQSGIVRVLRAKPTVSARMVAMHDPDDIAAMADAAYAELMSPEAGLAGSCKKLSAAERATLFPVLAKVCGLHLADGRVAGGALWMSLC